MGLFSSLFGGKKSLDSKNEAPYPSWKDDKNKLSEHFAIMIEWAESRNVPIKFVQGLTQTEYSRNKMLFTSGLLERQGIHLKFSTI